MGKVSFPCVYGRPFKALYPFFPVHFTLSRDEILTPTLPWKTSPSIRRSGYFLALLAQSGPVLKFCPFLLISPFLLPRLWSVSLCPPSNYSGPLLFHNWAGYLVSHLSV